MTEMQKRAAVFLDRDGTINVEKDYLHKIEDFEFIPGAVDAIRALREAGYLLIVVTNQSGVARGYYELGAVDKLHNFLQQELMKRDGSIDGFYVCPHHPTEGVGPYRLQCQCRKGAPGLLLQAALEHNIDLSGSFMIGDKLADIEAGERAGCTSILVLTGHGQSEREKLEGPEPIICQDLKGAVSLILARA